MSAFRQGLWIIMLYRVTGETACIDAVYHELQDYENLFSDELSDH